MRLRLLASIATVTMAALLCGSQAATAASPPSPFDLISEIGQIVHASTPTEASLLAADATIRNALNGTRAGYVYNLISDASQLADTSKEIASNAKATLRFWRLASADANHAKAFWKLLVPQFNGYQSLAQSTTVPAPCSQTPPSDLGCQAFISNFSLDWGGHVSVDSTAAIVQYKNTEIYLKELATSVNEALLETRALEGDAKDYTGNKQIEAAIQVLGEHEVAEAIGKLMVKAPGLEPYLKAQIADMRSCLTTGGKMALVLSLPLPLSPASLYTPPANACS